MTHALANPLFRRIYSAQVLALLGTGMMTIALALLAFDLAGARAGAVLGIALTLKMIAYVGFSPIAHAITERLPRKSVLVAADLIRLCIALYLPFIDAIWQIYLCIFALQLASATFTPAFQALIPDVFDDEETYTQALSLSRLAYELENILSPVIAGVLLSYISFHWLFGGTAIGFGLSAIIIAASTLPKRVTATDLSFAARATRGIRIYIMTPRLRGLWALTLAAASPGAFVLINTIIIVRMTYDLPETALAWASGAFGFGAMVAALGLPPLLKQREDRAVMFAGAVWLCLISLATGLIFSFGLKPDWVLVLVIWAALGVGYSIILTPTGRLLRRSAAPADRPAVFTAHFALSHAAWLLTYPIAGQLGAIWGMGPTLLVLTALAIIAVFAARLLWPAAQDQAPLHSHDNLPKDHPHLQGSHGAPHRHTYYIDDKHPYWPRTQ